MKKCDMTTLYDEKFFPVPLLCTLLTGAGYLIDDS